jgi:hypothetical protein
MNKRDPREHEFVFVDANGWEGLYIDGDLVEQGHTADIDIVSWLRRYGLNIRTKEAYNNPGIQENGLPMSLKDVHFD